MRLREIKFLLAKYSDKIVYQEQQLNNGNSYRVIGLEKAINAINQLSVLGFLDPDIERLKQFDTVYYSKSKDDQMILEKATHFEVKNIIRIAKEKTEGFQALIANSISEHKDDIVSVKLPEYNDLNDLSVFFKNLNQALKTGLMNDEIKANYHLQSFDTGSMWVDIAVTSGAAIKFLGEIIKTAMSVKEQSYQLQASKTHLSMLKIKEETLKDLQAAVDVQLDAIVEAETQRLKGEKEIDPEALNDIKHSVKTFSQLINEGAQFHPSLDAPQEVSESFPEPPKTELLGQAQGLLEQLASNLEDDDNE